jgi:hypothetical protein
MHCESKIEPSWGAGGVTSGAGWNWAVMSSNASSSSPAERENVRERANNGRRGGNGSEQTLKLVAGRHGEADVGVEARRGILVDDELRRLAPCRVPRPGTRVVTRWLALSPKKGAREAW